MAIQENWVGSSPETETVAAWWSQDRDKMWQHAIGVANSIEKAQSPRREQRLRHARLYGGREFRGFGVGEYSQVGASDRKSSSKIALNVIKACVDTAASKISKNKPRPLFLTSGGDYEMQEKAEGLTKYCDGQFDASNVYQAGQRAFVDACIFDTGCVRVFEEEGEIRTERVIIDEILVDEDDGRDMLPRQLHHVRLIDKSILIAMFPKFAREIAQVPRQHAQGIAETSASNLIKVYDSFHLRSGEKTNDGMRCISVQGATLYAATWEKSYLPYVFYRWTQPLVGFFGHSLVEELVGLQIQINKLLIQISRAIESAVPRVFIDNASMINPGAINDEIWGAVRYSGRPPTFAPTAAMSPEVYTFLWALYAKAFEITGISQMEATGKKPAGIDAAVALRELTDIASERFVLQGQRFEDFFMEIARITVDMTRDMALKATEAGEPGPSMKVKSGKFVETINWKDVDLDEDKFIMRTFPTNLLPAQPAGKLQTIKELVQDGFIPDKDQAMELLDFPDLEKFVSLRTAALDDVRAAISELLKKGHTEPPTKYMNLQLGLQMGQMELNRGRREKRPLSHLDALANWMQQIEDILNEQEAAAAPPMPPPGAMPPGAPPMPPDAGAPPPPPGIMPPMAA